MFLYAYIRSMVKDRLRAENRPKPAGISRTYVTARIRGASVRARTLTYASVRRKERKGNYFTNVTSLRLISTFTHLFNTYVNPCTLVRPI
jgi:hypothetical protein